MNFTSYSNNDRNETPHNCSSMIYSHDVGPCIVSVICIVFSFLYLIVGYRYLRSVFFITGFLFASLLIYLVCICLEEITLHIGITLTASIIAGLLFGMICALLFVIGFFITGFFTGFSLALISLIIVDQFVFPPSKWIAFGVVFGTSILFASLTVKFTRSLSILSTSLIGSALLIIGIDYLAEYSLLIQYCYDRLRTKPSPPLCWHTIVVMGGFPVLVIISLIIQLCATAKNVDHKERYAPCGVALRQMFCCDDRNTQQDYYSSSSQRRRVPPGSSSSSPGHRQFLRKGTSQESGLLLHHNGGSSHLLSSKGGSAGSGSLRHNRSGGGGSGPATLTRHGQQDPEVDKFCQLYRIRQMHGDVPSQSLLMEELFDITENSLSDCLFKLKAKVMRKMDAVRADYDLTIEKYKKEKSELNDKLLKKEETIVGKDMEIVALRHQIRSLENENPVCASCSQFMETTSSQDDEEDNNTLELVPKTSKQPAVNMRKRCRHANNASASSIEPSKPVEKRRRMNLATGYRSVPRHSSTILTPGTPTSLDEASPPLRHNKTSRSRPPHVPSRTTAVSSAATIATANGVKRRLNRYHRHGSASLSRQASASRSKGTPTTKECDSTQSLEVEIKLKTPPAKNPPTTNNQKQSTDLNASMALHVNDLSPASSCQIFDASFAIKNAVNHNDLAQMDETLLDDSSLGSIGGGKSSHQRSQHRQNKNVKTTTTSTVARYRQSRIGNFTYKNKVVDLVDLKRSAAVPKSGNNNFQDLDETSIDLTFNSECVDISVGGSPTGRSFSSVSHPIKAPPPANTASSKRHLPALGGSPTEQGFKRPLPPPPQQQQCLLRDLPVSDDIAVVTSSSQSQQQLSVPSSPLATSTLKLRGQSSETQIPSSKPDSLPGSETMIDSENSQQPPHLKESSSAVFGAGVPVNLRPPVDASTVDKHAVSLKSLKDITQTLEKPTTPKNAFRGHKYNAVERKKDERRKLPAFWCFECYEFYQSSGLSLAEIEDKMRNCSRHRAAFPPPPTPEGLWDLDIPLTPPTSTVGTTPTGGGKSEDGDVTSKAGAAARWRRRRPLCFPGGEGEKKSENVPPLALRVKTSAAGGHSSPAHV